MRILKAVTHTGLSSEMADQIEMLILEQHGGPGTLLEVELQETPTRRRGDHSAVGDRLQVEAAVPKPAELEVDIVIVVEIVDPQNIEACLLKSLEQMVADKAGAAGQKDLSHFSHTFIGHWK